MSSSEPRLVIEQSRTGAPTARLDGRFLHSRFDPHREATRFIDQVDPGDPRLILFLGPGLGHGIAPMRARFPMAKIVGIFLHADTFSAASFACEAAWHPEARESLREFLSRSIPEVLIGQVAVIEWQPSLDAFDDKATIIQTEVAGFLRETQASVFTTGAAGRLRLHNVVKNLGRLRPTSWRTDGKNLISAIVVTGAGPSLEQALPAIQRARPSISLWATGSSVEALLEAGLTPDVVVVTEPSIYASFHVRSLIASGSPTRERSPVIVAPISVCSTVAEASAIVLFGENDLPERLLAPALPRLPVIPSRGTVTFTAVAIARTFGNHPVVLAGADFAHFQERSHVRPHLAHRYRGSISSRTSPGAGFVFERTRMHAKECGGWSTDRTLTTYAHWLRSQGREAFAPLYQLAPSPVATTLPILSDDELSAFPVHFGSPMFLHSEPTQAEPVRARIAINSAVERVSAARISQPPAVDVLQDSPIRELAAHLAVQRLLRYAKTGERAEWIELCREVEQELRRASEFVS